MKIPLRTIKLDQSVLAVVGDYFVEVLGDSNGDRTVVGFWNRF